MSSHPVSFFKPGFSFSVQKGGGTRQLSVVISADRLKLISRLTSQESAKIIKKKRIRRRSVFMVNGFCRFVFGTWSDVRIEKAFCLCNTTTKIWETEKSQRKLFLQLFQNYLYLSLPKRTLKYKYFHAQECQNREFQLKLKSLIFISVNRSTPPFIVLFPIK